MLDISGVKGLYIMSIYISIPRFSNTGGNLVSLELAKVLNDDGINVLCFSGYKFKKPADVSLVVYDKGILNTILNLMSFLSCSFLSLFFKHHVATHHLTSIFNFIKPSSFAFVQDVEADFYPQPIKPIGVWLWNNYLKSKNIIFTNQQLLSKSVKSKHAHVDGFPSVDLELTKQIYRNTIAPEYGNHDFDAVMILRDGEYKNPTATLNCFKFLVSNGLKVAIINSSKLSIESDNENGVVFNALSRDEFLRLLTRANFFICLSSWEGLGLPNIEAFVLGVKVISTNIPSASLLNSSLSDSIFIVNPDPLDVLTIIKNNSTTCSCTIDFNGRIDFLKQQNEKWNTYVLSVFRGVLVHE